MNRPNSYTIPNERITVLEALGLAGDMTIQAERRNVLVIREENGKKTYNRIDLTSETVFNSKVYYLTQNDIVYVEPNGSAISVASGDARIGLITGIASFLLSTVLIFVTRR